VKVRTALLLLLLAFSSIITWDQGGAGTVYTASNSPAGNAILVFERAANGALTPAGVHPTGGTGTGSGLGNQSAVILSDTERFLFVVNAGSNTISSLAVKRSGLELVDTINSGGVRPVSLAQRGRLLFVLNAGGNSGAQDNIAGFRVDRSGKLSAIS